MDTGIQKYQAFVTTVETGSFSLAARALSYSQSGISRMIADLESEWKVQLLERGRSGVRLTSDGVKLLPYAKSLLREYENLRHAIDGLAGLENGLLRIGAHKGVPAARIAAMLSEFSAACPGIDYELISGSYTEVEDMVRTGRVDLGLSRFPAASSLTGSLLYQESLVALTAEPAAGIFSIADLGGEPFVLLESDGQDDVSALLKKCSVSPRIRAVCDDAATATALVAAGLGRALIPESAASKLPAGVFAVPLDVPAYVSTGLILRSKKNASVAVRRFLEIFD